MRLLFIVGSLLLTGCMSYHPPASASWAYRGTLKGGISFVAYAPSLAMCQTMREKDMPKVDVADFTVSGISECGPVVVKAGTGWFAFAIVEVPEIGMAVNDAAGCALAREHYVTKIPLANRSVGTGSWMYAPAYRVTKCSPVTVDGS